MESVIQIHSLSHGEFRRLTSPNSFEFPPGLSLIDCESTLVSGDLGVLLKICFNPTNVEKENRDRLLGDDEEIIHNHCNIEFSTPTTDYLLKRIFWSDQTSELSLMDLKTNEVLFDDEAGAVLKNIISPILLASHGDYTTENSIVYNGNSPFSRARMGSMVTTWARTLGYTIPKIEVDEYGIWCTNDGWNTEAINYNLGGWTSAIHLLKNVSQAVVRKDIKGSCPPIYLGFDSYLGVFDQISLIDFVKGICKENQIQFIISMKGVPTTESNIQFIS